jgi:prepilin-type N-terminal cleavage/methylation domain-containing protein
MANPLKRYKRFALSEKGFSMIELMTVMIIISILVGIAVAVYSDVSKKPANEAHNANVRTLISCMHMALSDHGADAFGGLDEDKPVWHKSSRFDNSEDVPCWTNYLQEWPVVPAESGFAGDYEVYLDYPGPSVRVELKQED